jgi:hypothetical protein
MALSSAGERTSPRRPGPAQCVPRVRSPRTVCPSPWPTLTLWGYGVEPPLSNAERCGPGGWRRAIRRRQTSEHYRRAMPTKRPTLTLIEGEGQRSRPAESSRKRIDAAFAPAKMPSNPPSKSPSTVGPRRPRNRLPALSIVDQVTARPGLERRQSPSSCRSRPGAP